MNKKNILPVVLVPTCLLMIPAAAMLFQAEGFAWSPFDFVAMWVLIAGAVAAYRLVASKAPNRSYRFAAGIGVGTGLFLVWVNGAVGLIGSEDNPANALYGVVLAIGLLGAALARLRPAGMSRALFATAIAQFLVPVVAMIVWRPDFAPGVVQVFVLNFCFVTMFAVSAILFRHSGGTADRAGEPIAA